MHNHSGDSGRKGIEIFGARFSIQLDIRIIHNGLVFSGLFSVYLDMQMFC